MIEKYSEPLDKYISLLHEACEGRYELTGYDLNVIEAALLQFKPTLSDTEIEKAIQDKALEKYPDKNIYLNAVLRVNFIQAAKFGIELMKGKL